MRQIVGRCTKCRCVKAVTWCKIEAFVGEARPVEAALCDPCRDGIKVAVVTPLPEYEARPLTELYQ